MSFFFIVLAGPQALQEKKIVAYMKLSKLVKNRANLIYFSSHIFGQIAYFRDINVKIETKIPFYLCNISLLPHVHLKNDFIFSKFPDLKKKLKKQDNLSNLLTRQNNDFFSK